MSFSSHCYHSTSQPQLERKELLLYGKTACVIIFAILFSFISALIISLALWRSWTGIVCDEEGSVIRINLQEANLSGPIPPSIGDLTNLLVLSLHNNSLDGTIPEEIGNLKRLRSLSLGSNFSGVVPDCLGNFSDHLLVMNLAMNQFEGTIPRGVQERKPYTISALGKQQINRIFAKIWEAGGS
ncbi:hypothetical protein HAX54_052229 [Datura stramonium]|uniref:Uncharacterized protein n=1 Tax=Datura stramonium TaxID=4076 RepID=A0ABS8T0G8_DATST|nr:hypothetical protein [Datura stramonium]